MTQLYEIDGYHYIVDLTPYFVLGVLVIALVCAIAVLVRRILASPFRYPYYVARFDVSGRRNVRIEDYIDRHLMDPAGWDAIVAHRAYIQNWKHEQEEYLKTCRLRSRRERQYAEAVDDDRAFRFITCRDQTRYKQANYVKTSYKVSMDDSELDVNWEWMRRASHPPRRYQRRGDAQGLSRQEPAKADDEAAARAHRPPGQLHLPDMREIHAGRRGPARRPYRAGREGRQDRSIQPAGALLEMQRAEGRAVAARCRHALFVEEIGVNGLDLVDLSRAHADAVVDHEAGERAAVAARLVLDDDRQAEGLLEGLGQAASYLSPFSLVVADPLTIGSRAS